MGTFGSWSQSGGPAIPDMNASPAGSAAPRGSLLRRAAAVALPVLAVDQVAKVAIRHTLPLCAAPFTDCRRITVLGPVGIMRLENVRSVGGLIGGSLVWIVLVVVAVALSPLYLRRFRPSWFGATAIGLQVAGLMSNIIDLIVLGRVTDYLAIRIRSVPTPRGPALEGAALNLGDLALVVGSALAIVHLLSRRSSAPRDDAL